MYVYTIYSIYVYVYVLSYTILQLEKKQTYSVEKTSEKKNQSDE